jgi:hypothetical protein
MKTHKSKHTVDFLGMGQNCFNLRWQTVGQLFRSAWTRDQFSNSTCCFLHGWLIFPGSRPHTTKIGRGHTGNVKKVSPAPGIKGILTQEKCVN